MLVVEQGQRWRCRTYSPRSTVVVPYSSTESVNTVPLKDGHEKETLLYFRQGTLSHVLAAVCLNSDCFDSVIAGTRNTSALQPGIHVSHLAKFCEGQSGSVGLYFSAHWQGYASDFGRLSKSR